MGILIVEDEPLIAMDMETTLRGAGMDVIGLVGSTDDALDWLQRQKCACVVLDANLGGTSGGKVAEVLLQQAVPFVVLSGYTPDQLHPAMARAPFLSKPYSPPELVAQVKGLLEQQPAPTA